MEKMSLSKHQQIFAEHVMRLLLFIISNGYKVTFGEAQRTIEQQKIYFDSKKSLTMDSMHLKKLAIDLNFFDKQNNLTYDKNELTFIADYWKSLDPLNRWGGDFKRLSDTPHFERFLK